MLIRAVYRFAGVALLLLVQSIAMPTWGNAEPQLQELPAAFADFAINPSTGDVAAVDAQQNSATLLLKKYFDGDKSAIVGPVKFGNAPCSVTFKRFGEKSYFAVVCLRDSNLYLLDAESFKPAKKIGLLASGVTLATCSQNPADPFVYYSCREDRDPLIAAVDLRTMADCGVVMRDYGDMALSASGTVAYRRRTHMSSDGFEALQLQSGFEAEKPRFAMLYAEHQDSLAYIPDPFDQYTAMGDAIYSRDLSKKIASFDFVPLCFFAKSPLIVGENLQATPAARTRGKARAEEPAPLLQLQAASWNSMTPKGKAVELPASIVGDPKELEISRRGRRNLARLDEAAFRRKLLADEVRDRVIYAYRNHAAVVPRADFEVPAEPLLKIEIDGPKLLEIDKLHTIQLIKPDENLRIEAAKLPPGMTQTAEGLAWKPTREQIGPVTLDLTLKSGEFERQQTISFAVAAPSVQLPFMGQGIAINPAGTTAIAWGEVPADPRARGADSSANPTLMAIVDLANRKVKASKPAPFAIALGAISDQYVFLVDNDRKKVEVLDLATLEPKKTLFANGSIASLEVIENNRLAVHEHESSSSYSLPSLERLFVGQAGGRALGGSHLLNPQLDGPQVDGMLVNDAGKPELLLDPTPLMDQTANRHVMPRNPAGGPISFQNRLRAMENRARGPRTSTDGRGGRTETSAPVRLAALPAAAAAEILIAMRHSGIRTYVGEGEVTLVLSDLVTDTVRQRIKLFKGTRLLPVQGNNQQYSAFAAAGDKSLAVLFEDRLYPHSLADADMSAFPRALRFKPQQTTFVVPPRGKTELLHQLEGGKPPYKISFSPFITAATYDDAAGKITIDGARVAEQAETLLLGTFGGYQPNGPAAADRLKKYCDDYAPRAEKLLGRQPTGPLVAMRISAQGTDSESQSAMLQYYVLVELPADAIVAKILLKEAEAKARYDAQVKTAGEQRRPGEASAPPTGDQSQEIERLKRKVEALEERIDLLTREVNRLKPANPQAPGNKTPKKN
jgi:hypothetical protein